MPQNNRKSDEQNQNKAASPSWTDEQKSVITTRNKNMLVAAAAGSGKTAVLVERIIQLVTDEKEDIDIDRILVVTFTKAAAGEMKDRLRRKLEEKLQENPTNEKLLRQSTLVHNARICTIDSFCSYVVKNYFYTIGIEPGFSMATKGELKTLQMQVMKEIIEKHLEDQDEAFKELLNAYSTGVSTDGFAKIIIDIWDKALSFPWPEEWLDESMKLYSAVTPEELDDAEWLKALLDDARQAALEALPLIEEALEICNEPDGADVCISILESDYELYESVAAAKTYNEMRTLVKRDDNFTAWSKAKYRTDKTLINIEKKENAKSLRDAAKENFENATGKKGGKFFETPDIILEKLELLRDTVEGLISVAKEYGVALMDAKRSKNMYEFTDVEHLALDILRDKNDTSHLLTDVARELADTYMQVMVDEYQDSNMLQEAILTAVCKNEKGKHDYFMVGDVKQSIYSFRRATPALFMAKQEEYTRYKNDTDGSAESVLIDLNKNFRSRGEVLTITNRVFEVLMKKDMGRVLYDADAALYLGNKNYQGENEHRCECEAELILVDPAAASEATTLIAQNSGDASDSGDFSGSEGGSYDEGAESESNANSAIIEGSIAGVEAKVVAERILELKENYKIYNEKEQTYRNTKFSDIVILMRSLKNVGKEFVDALRNVGIPAYLESENGFFDANEIMFVLSYLRLIDNSYDDVSLAAVLHSPVYGISNDEMLKMKTAIKKNAKSKGKDAFFLAVYTYENPSEKLEKFFSDLNELRSISGFEPVHVIIDRIMQVTGCKNFFGIINGGLRRLSNLDKLTDMAVSFENSGDMSVSGFNRYIENMIAEEEDPGLSSTISENDDVVRIMTIHKSKGLEFPVVFLSQTAHQFNDSDLRSDIIVSEKSGIGVKYRNSVKKQKTDTLIHKWIASAAKKDSRGEELRMLYVAMTRAKEKLIITGTVKGGQDGFEKIAEKIKGFEIPLNQRTGATNYLNWIIMTIRAYQNRNEAIPLSVTFRKTRAELVDGEVNNTIEGEIRQQFDILSNRYDVDFDEALETLRKDITYEYPYNVTAKFKSKYSVSEIKHRDIHQLEEDENQGQRIFECPDEDEYIPAFIRGTELVEKEAPAGAVYGTAVHRFFELYDFARDDYKTSVKEQLDHMKETHLMTDEQADFIHPKRFENFFDSELAERMHIADKEGKLHREQPFVWQASPKRLEIDENDDVSRVLIQGEIDVFFEEEDGIVLLDYKTDRVECARDLVVRYTTQLYLYRDALIGAYGKPVKEVLIYSMCLGETIDVR